MNVKRSVSVSGAELEMGQIGRHRMLGIKIDGLLQQLEQAGGEGDATLTFCKRAGGYYIHGTMWVPEREG